MADPPGEITVLLSEARAGDESALDRVFQFLYPELRRLAASKMASLPLSDTLTPTALVHESYLRFIGAAKLDLESRAHFFACAARAMRQILIDSARSAGAEKRGGDRQRVTLSPDLPVPATTPAEILDLEKALVELQEINERALEVVELRFFAGLTAEQTAELLGISLRTANREWQKARAFLYARLYDQEK